MAIVRPEVPVAHGHWSEVEGRAVVAAWEKSGLTVEQFAKARGLIPQRIRWWRKRLERTDTTPKLVPVQLVEAKRGEPVTVLLRSGHMLKVGRGFDEDAFARVVAVLERG
jgi:hypothetical protein